MSLPTFGNELRSYQERVSTWEKARAEWVDAERKRLERKEEHQARRPGDRPKNVQEPSNKAAALDAILDYLTANSDASLREIGRHIGRSKSTAGNYVDELQQAGRLHKNGDGWEVI